MKTYRILAAAAVIAALAACNTKTDEAQADAERAQTLQDVIVVADDGNHLVVRFIHFLILHR